MKQQNYYTCRLYAKKSDLHYDLSELSYFLNVKIYETNFVCPNNTGFRFQTTFFGSKKDAIVLCGSVNKYNKERVFNCFQLLLCRVWIPHWDFFSEIWNRKADITSAGLDLALPKSIQIYFLINISINFYMYWIKQHAQLEIWPKTSLSIIVVCKCFRLRGQFSLRYHWAGSPAALPLCTLVQLINMTDTQQFFYVLGIVIARLQSTLVITRRATHVILWNSKYYTRTQHAREMQRRVFELRECARDPSGGYGAEETTRDKRPKESRRCLNSNPAAVPLKFINVGSSAAVGTIL